ncbi:hypothetical protein RHSIM_Rhsim07G0216100 [Rhododendron simsii]|uniref:Uncharacterized protein n=1 Tax=Rhododendron simsii TaxID=118357 RepID=A0A834GQQ8_RHOSS|nr:hypothetical protein RHSIM_Rhsim07G0216100 [Rhododendron simsii]
MCYEAKCSKCGKTSWGGCGLHVRSVYNRIPEGQHCQCKGWPGVKTGGKTGGEGSSTATNGGEGVEPTGVTVLQPLRVVQSSEYHA